MTTASPDLLQFADKLRTQTIAVRVHHEKMGVRRALTREQIALAAEQFGAKAGAIGASKKLLDTRHPIYKRVVTVRSHASRYWRSLSVPYPEPGVRLIRRDRVEQFEAQMVRYREELDAATADLQAQYAVLREQARRDLGDLFNAGDYPARIDLEFSLSWDYPNIEPPAYLKNIHPHLYEQECERIRVRFEEAVRLTEQAFVQQFHELVSHLADRLTGDTDGKPKVFKNASLLNLGEFFEQFKTLNVGSSAELEQLVTQAQKVVEGIDADKLRDSAELRASVGQQLTTIQTSLDSLMVDRPTRAITLEDEDDTKGAAA